MDMQELLSALAELPQTAPTSAAFRNKAYNIAQEKITYLHVRLKEASTIDGEYSCGNATMGLPLITHLVFEII